MACRLSLAVRNHFPTGPAWGLRQRTSPDAGLLPRLAGGCDLAVVADRGRVGAAVLPAWVYTLRAGVTEAAGSGRKRFR